MATSEFILYGGYEGTDKEICQNAESLGEGLFNSLRAYGNKIVLVDGITGYEVSGLALLSKAVHLAQYLKDSFGIKAGDAISICSENRIEFVVTLHATLFLGATFAPLNNAYIENELNHALSLSKPKVIFSSPMNLDKVTAVAKKNKFVQHIIAYPDPESNVKTGATNVISYATIMASENPSNVNQFKCEAQNMKENVAIILCSSGTTGLPKGVQLTQFNMFVAAIQPMKRARAQEMPDTGERIILGNLPIFHAFGICVFLTCILEGITKFILIPRFTEKICFSSIQKYRINTVYFVPPIMVLLAKSPLVNDYDLSSLRVIWCGAAPLSKKLEMEVKNRIGVKHVRQGYGMTEGTFAFCAQDDDLHSHGSVGPLNPGVYARVVDVETGKLLGPNEVGELHFKGTCIMKGYVGDKQATSASIDSDGWLHTGDVGYYDEKGEFYLVDRIKELIKYKGFQVPPAEIEALLLTNPKIKDVGVVGVPDEKCGETAFAFVVKQPNATITEQDVIKYVAERLSNPKRLHGGIKFVDAIPKSPTGKILRRVLRDMVKNLKSKL